MDKVKLADRSGIFYDPETGFRVQRAQVVELAEPVGRLTREWLNGGGLVIVGAASQKAPSPEAKGEVSDSFSSPDASSADVDVTPEPGSEVAAPETAKRSHKATKKK